MQLARQRGFGRFARFALAAGKFPQAGQVAPFGATRQQDASARVLEDAGDDFDERGWSDIRDQVAFSRLREEVPRRMRAGDTLRAPLPHPESRNAESRLLSQLPMAMLVLLAAAAGAGIVAADLGHAGLQRASPWRRPAACAASLVRAQTADVGVLELHLARLRLGLAALLGFHRRDFGFAADAHAREQRARLRA